jgi:phosphatidylglycerophosphate synthase
MSETKRDRVSTSFLQPLEKPTLLWIAQRLPPWVTSDMLTMLGVIGTLVIFAGYALTGWSRGFLWLASLGFVINWLGDSLDGTLARVRRQERPRYGFFIDHGVDCFSQPTIILAMAFTPFVRLDSACLALIGYLMISVFSFIRRIASGTLHLSYGRVGPTEARVAVIIANAIMVFTEPVHVVTLWAPMTVYDLLMVTSLVGAVVALIITFIQEARRLAIEDPLPKR